ncbi:MAG: hypothetical protein HYU03_03185 [Thaumarchaeota archaeon]|nr:hypothetical protein [Nitrososphaerota archaeon]MCS4539677.1 hypothetical protein [Nitrososphaerota archaeon]
MMIWKTILVTLLMILFVASAATARSYRATSGINSIAGSQAPEMLGYNYDRDADMVSVALWNRGDSPVNLTAVIYDGTKLSMGLTGSTITLPTNDLIFVAVDHWNMDTGGPSRPTMQPNSLATLYLGVPAGKPGSMHTLVIVSPGEAYEFKLQS